MPRLRGRQGRRRGDRRVLAAAVGAVLAVLAAGCSAGDDSDDDGGGDRGDGTHPAVEVLPFEQVQAGEMTFEPDPADPTRAIFRVETTEPMICAVVWGEDESFGRMHNSLTMEGTGITDHEVILPEVEPGREYRFVVQGSTADGTLYRSEVDGFTIDPDEVGEAGGTPGGSTGLGDEIAPELGDNLAADATVSAVSSAHSDAFAARHAIDGDPATEWSSDGDGDGAYLVLDLGEPSSIAGVAYLTRSMADGSATTTTFTVQVDGGEPVGPFPAGTLEDPQVAPVEATGREVRIDVASSTGGNTGAVEILVLAP